VLSRDGKSGLVECEVGWEAGWKVGDACCDDVSWGSFVDLDDQVVICF